MCSIFGAFGNIDKNILNTLKKQAGDRGRDGGRITTYKDACLGSWRATPVTEAEQAPLQPYDGIVHNGVIANDKVYADYPVDSMVLPDILDRSSLLAFRDSLNQKVVGSYAIAAWTGKTIYLACNYKPLYYWSPDGKTTYFSSMARHFNGIVPYWQSPVKMTPYSVLDLSTFVSMPLSQKKEKKAVVICSGGMDSTTVAAYLVKQGYRVHLLHFLYGCNAQTQEAQRIPLIAEALSVTYDIIPVNYEKYKGESALFSSNAPSKGIEGVEYAKEWVPARNLVLLSLSTAYAEANGYHYIALGNNLEEAGAYPDNEEEFTTLFSRLLPNATQNGYAVEVVSPLGNLMKHEIVALGVELNAPLHLTWSCYRGQGKHCGECPSCFMRKKAFERNGLTDPVF